MPWPETIQSERLILRPPRDDDAKPIFEGYAQDAEVTRYLMWRPHRELAEAQEYVRRCQARWSYGSELTWLLVRRADQELLGAIALRPAGHKADVGYVLARRFWGQSLMPEAGRARTRRPGRRAPRRRYTSAT